MNVPRGVERLWKVGIDLHNVALGAAVTAYLLAIDVIWYFGLAVALLLTIVVEHFDKGDDPAAGIEFDNYRDVLLFGSLPPYVLSVLLHS